MEEFSRCALGTYYYSATLERYTEPTEIYIQSQEDRNGCGGGAWPLIFKDWDARRWIGTVIVFLYCILLKVSLLKFLYIYYCSNINFFNSAVSAEILLTRKEVPG